METAPPGRPPTPDYNLTPQVIFWEVTWACALRCRHCRAVAQPKRHPDELTTEEGSRLLEEIARFGQPIVIMTGGDPFMRHDLFELIAHGVGLGLHVTLAPSVTALVTPQNLLRAYEAGVRRLSFSLDGVTAEAHDSFRGVPGSFERTLKSIRMAQEAGIAVQINTCVNRRNVSELGQMAQLLQDTAIVLWDLFFLVPTGRALLEDVVSPEEHEAVFNWLYDYSQASPFPVRSTLGQHYRRVATQRGGPEAGRRAGSTNDGRGVCFISHLGNIYPSGFLPVTAGNVRRDSLVDVYRGSPLFRALRDPSRLKGKCGVCEFNAVCGGCRARAYAVTGDYLAAEPYCIYQPPAWRDQGHAPDVQ
ncbi:MAG: radical SAM protein [Chloroflexi bacterium]|nr:radical SAM protein [Chloroflexota bacterium]